MHFFENKPKVNTKHLHWQLPTINDCGVCTNLTCISMAEKNVPNVLSHQKYSMPSSFFFLSKYFISICKSLFRGIHIQSSESNCYANFDFIGYSRI